MSVDARIPVRNDELHTVRGAMREMHRLVDALERGELEKVVLTTGTLMRAVVLPVETYARWSAGLFP